MLFKLRTDVHLFSVLYSESNKDIFFKSKSFVTGQDQHFGTRAPPRELQLENSVMPPDPGVVRVQVVYQLYKTNLLCLLGALIIQFYIAQ